MNYEPFTSIENLTLAHFRHFIPKGFSSLFTYLPSTYVENPLQIDLFMQNKPKVKNAQINVSYFITSIYVKVDTWLSGKNKANSNPIKPNLRKAKMNVNSLTTKDYRKKDDFTVRINKPNSNPISVEKC